LNFHTISGWLDTNIDKAQQSWRGNEARRTIEEVMQRAHTGINVTDSVSTQMDFSRTKTPDQKDTFAEVFKEKLENQAQQTRDEMKTLFKSKDSVIPNQFEGWNITQ
jgi:hypothetical protein